MKRRHSIDGKIEFEMTMIIVSGVKESEVEEAARWGFVNIHHPPNVRLVQAGAAMREFEWECEWRGRYFSSDILWVSLTSLLDRRFI